MLELALAVHKRAIYPPGHPLLRGAVESLLNRVNGALEGRTSLSIGVARTTLIVEGVATDEHNPLQSDLAGHLHAHQLAALRFIAGVSREEIDDLLSLIAVPALRLDQPLGTMGADVLSRWRHIALFPASFDQLELAEGEGAGANVDSATAPPNLWLDLARTALASADRDADDDTYDPLSIAGAINAHGAEGDFAKVVMGHFQQIADELQQSTRGSRSTERLKGRVSTLIASLSPETLTRLMEMGGDAKARERFLKQMTDSLSASAIMDLVRATASASSKSISESMLRLLGKLARNAGGSRREATNADRLLRSEVRTLVEGWTLDDPNPEGYSELLRGIGHSDSRAEADTGRDTCEPERIIEISLECGTVGPSTEHAMGQWVKRAGMATVIEFLTALPQGPVRESLINSLLTVSVLGDQLTAERPNVRVLEHAVVRLRERATEPLLEALGKRDEKDALWICDLISQTGPGGMAIITTTLLKRNATSQRILLGVLDRANLAPSDADLEKLARSDDPLLRREALRLMIKQPATQVAGIVRALRDRDEKTVAMALAQAPKEPTPAVIGALMTRLSDGDDLNEDLRSRGVKAVASSGREEAVAWLSRLVLSQHWLLRYTKLRKASPETVAAVAGLAAHWRTHPQATLALLLARRSTDASYRHAVRRGEEQ